MSDTYSVIDAARAGAWHDEADVVIAGLGVAGACAAIEARLAGASVVVLERASGGGGTTANAAGHVYLGGGTRVQKAVGVEDDVESMYTYLLLNTPVPEPDKIRLYCDDSVSHFDWLVAQGVPFNDSMYPGKHFLQMTDECLIWSGNEEVWPFREKARPAPRGHKVAQVGEGGGAKLMECLVARARALGVRIEVDSAVQQLIRDGERIAGVRVKHFDETKNVRARRGVVLATGHFTGNAELLAKHTPRLLEEGITRQFTPFDDGAGLLLGRAAGGEWLHLDGALITSPFYPPEQLIKGILVNREGRRFVAEDSYHSRSSIYATQQPGGEAYLIVDEKIFARPLFGHAVVDGWESVPRWSAASACRTDRCRRRCGATTSTLRRARTPSSTRRRNGSCRSSSRRSRRCSSRAARPPTWVSRSAVCACRPMPRCCAPTGARSRGSTPRAPVRRTSRRTGPAIRAAPVSANRATSAAARADTPRRSPGD